jgi:hypothetical protein
VREERSLEPHLSTLGFFPPEAQVAGEIRLQQHARTRNSTGLVAGLECTVQREIAIGFPRQRNFGRNIVFRIVEIDHLTRRDEQAGGDRRRAEGIAGRPRSGPREEAEIEGCDVNIGLTRTALDICVATRSNRSER